MTCQAEMGSISPGWAQGTRPGLPAAGRAPGPWQGGGRGLGGRRPRTWTEGLGRLRRLTWAAEPAMEPDSSVTSERPFLTLTSPPLQRGPQPLDFLP